jgi:hypothetical protein
LLPTSPPDGADPAEFSEATGCTKISGRENSMLLHKMFNCKVRGLARFEGCADGRGAIVRHEFLPAFWSSYTKRRSGWVVSASMENSIRAGWIRAGPLLCSRFVFFR